MTLADIYIYTTEYEQEALLCLMIKENGEEQY